ncbi:MAG: DUF971 domain-containing protein [Phycisphaerae bacterium]
MLPAKPANYPERLDLDRGGSLKIRWMDGLEQVISLAALRRACPCATCRAERESQSRNPLRILSVTASPQDQVTVGEAALVGNYALRIEWKDGHNSGIYDFELLRNLT